MKFFPVFLKLSSIVVLPASFLLTACYKQPEPVSYVSASGQNYQQHVVAPMGNEKPHDIAHQNNPQEYISAWIDAQVEEERNRQEVAVRSPKFAGSTKDFTHQGFANHRFLNTGFAGQNLLTNFDNISDVWGQPPGIEGQGFTLINKEMRERLNDALSTTPVNGEAKWRHGNRNFIFMPNSEIYQPYHSGGDCRDAILVHYSNSSQERLRGLFCRQGRGSDWLLVR